jgi:site-specific recombinase XerD
MANNQLPLFRTGARKRGQLRQVPPAAVPTGESTVMQTLPAYLAHLGNTYAPKTAKTYGGDVRELSLFLRGRKLGELKLGDLQDWRTALVTAPGQSLQKKTVARKVSAVINYFGWLHSIDAITVDPSVSLVNARVQSPLPDYLYESETEKLYQVASADPRTYLLVLLFLETGMKSSELFRLTFGDVDTSDPYSPELWIKHTGKAVKKDRKVALPHRFVGVYEAYLEKYQVSDVLFPFTDRFGQLLFAALKSRSGIKKVLTPKTLRHTHVVRAYRRGEDPELILDRIGLAPDSRKEADEMYTRLAARGM